MRGGRGSHRLLVRILGGTPCIELVLEKIKMFGIESPGMERGGGGCSTCNPRSTTPFGVFEIGMLIRAVFCRRRGLNHLRERRDAGYIPYAILLELRIEVLQVTALEMRTGAFGRAVFHCARRLLLNCKEQTAAKNTP